MTTEEMKQMIFKNLKNDKSLFEEFSIGIQPIVEEHSTENL